MECTTNETTYSILNIDGRILKRGKVLNEKINNLDFLTEGTYLLHIETIAGTIVKKILTVSIAIRTKVLLLLIRTNHNLIVVKH